MIPLALVGMSYREAPSAVRAGLATFDAGSSGPSRQLLAAGERATLPAWVEVERKLSAMPSTQPTRVKFLDLVNYYGQTSELDGQGRIVIPQHLREKASIVGDVRVFGRIDFLEVWNEERFAHRLDREPWTDEDALRLAEFGI